MLGRRAVLMAALALLGTGLVAGAGCSDFSSSVGGTDADAAADGDAGTDASDSALTDAARDAVLSPTDGLADCRSGTPPLGEFATWVGKVNVHRGPNGPWVVDNDCQAGATFEALAYCQRFWPASAAQLEIPVSATLKPFTNPGAPDASPGCGGLFADPGQKAYVCCMR